MIKKSALFIIASAFLLSACTLTGSAQTTPPTTPSSTAPKQIAENTIIISNFAFSPQTLTVKPGSVITVTNNDSATHTVTSDDNTSFNISSISQGSSATFTAPTKPGTYAFHCAIHRTMTGTLIVQ